MRIMGGMTGILLLALGLPVVQGHAALPVAVQQSDGQNLRRIHDRLAKEVRHELLLLPFYDVFDNLEFSIEGVDTVVLAGQVTRPTLRSDAENVVKKLEGVGKVVNKIEVLPLSPNDDRIRAAVFRAVYSTTGLDRYAFRAVPTIHIIVKNGHVTLVGAVGTQMDKSLAETAARGVSGVFSVTNNLRTDK